MRNNKTVKQRPNNKDTNISGCLKEKYITIENNIFFSKYLFCKILIHIKNENKVRLGLRIEMTFFLST
jgi:hypothetical protein